MQDEQVNILKCCGGHENHLDNCAVFLPEDDLFLDEDDMPWAPGLL